MVDDPTHEALAELRHVVRRFALEQVAPNAQAWDQQASFPDSIIPVLAAHGFLGILVPEQYGGSGGSFQAFAIILEEIARHDGGLALAIEAHNGLACEHIRLAGNPQQCQRFLPSLAKGSFLGSWCLSEPGSGTDAIAMQTRAVRDGSSWVINGSKQFITNGSRAGLFVVMAVTTAHDTRPGVSAFVVERDAPGLTIGPRERKHGMRSSDTVPLTFEDVRVEDSCRLGPVDEAFTTVKKVLLSGRVMVAALALGLHRGAMEESVRYASERRSFGKPIDQHQLIQAKLANIAIGYEAAKQLVGGAVAGLDLGSATLAQACVAKVFAAEAAANACRDALQIHGGYGYLSDYVVERYLRDALLCEIGEGTSEILRVLIARDLAKRHGEGTL